MFQADNKNSEQRRIQEKKNTGFKNYQICAGSSKIILMTQSLTTYIGPRLSYLLDYGFLLQNVSEVGEKISP
jgi:hypothetical protein